MHGNMVCRERFEERRTQWWIVAGVLLVLVRLVLVSHHEVMTMGWDSIGYVGFSSKMYWGSAYDQFSYTRVPTFPLLMSLCTLLGVPFRLAEEAVLIAAACWTAKAGCACGLRKSFAFALFTGVLFEPWTVRQFDVIVPDGMYACFLLMTVCQVVVVWNALVHKHKALWHSVVLGGLLAITGTLRQEWPVAVLPGFVAGVSWWNVVRWRRQLLQSAVSTSTKRSEWRSYTLCAVAFVVVPCAMLLNLNLVYSAINSKKIGLFATSDFLAPGYTKLHKALLSIPSERGAVSSKLQAPTDVRIRVYQVSPTMKLLQPWLEGDCLKDAAAMTRDISPEQDEYGAWLVFGIRSAAFRYKKWECAGELDRIFETAADEIRRAQERGEIARRWTPFSFVAPEWRPLAEQLPKSAAVSWKFVVSTRDSFSTVHAQKLPEFESMLYDHVALRRGGLARLQYVETSNQPAVNATMWHRSKVRAFVDNVWDVIFRVRGVVLRWLWWMPIVGLVCLIPQVIRSRNLTTVQIFLVLLVVCAAARLALVILLDASGVWAQPRYLLASVMLMRVALMVTILSGFDAVLGVWQSRSNRA